MLDNRQVYNMSIVGGNLIEPLLENYKNAYTEIPMEKIKTIFSCTTFSFCISNINRLESMLICEMGDSYVQQSQRYVKYDKFYIEENNIIDPLIIECFDLYNEMIYDKSIPCEDARYILPLTSSTTNIQITINGLKLICFILEKGKTKKSNISEKKCISYSLLKKIINCENYIENNFPNIYKMLFDMINSMEDNNISKEVQKFIDSSYDMTSLNKNIIDELPINYIIENNKVIKIIDSSIDAYGSMGKAALISRTKTFPIPYDADHFKNVTKRVIGYGHEGIMEHYTSTSIINISLAAYHQLIRHRIPTFYRPTLEFSLFDNSNTMTEIPDSIINNPYFYEKYIDLLNRIKQYRIDLYSNSVNSDYSLNYYDYILNCDKINICMISNLRADKDIMQLRLCKNSQSEIRKIFIEKLFLLKEKMPDFYFNDFYPSCIRLNKCSEEDFSCKKPLTFKDIEDERNAKPIIINYDKEPIQLKRPYKEKNTEEILTSIYNTLKEYFIIEE